MSSTAYRVALRCLIDAAEDASPWHLGGWDWVAQRYYAAGAGSPSDFVAALGISDEAIRWAVEVLGLIHKPPPSLEDVTREIFRAFEEHDFAISGPHDVVKRRHGTVLRRATIGEWYASRADAVEHGGDGITILDVGECFGTLRSRACPLCTLKETKEP